MKIGIVGIGIVGFAMYESLNIKMGSSLVIAYDKYKSIGNIDDILETDINFLCLPTLFKNNAYDTSAIYEVCEYLTNNKYHGIVVIKSTVEPGVSQTIAELFDLRIFHNPEFLTASTAFDDFHNQSHVIIGKTTKIIQDDIDVINKFYVEYYPYLTK